MVEQGQGATESQKPQSLFNPRERNLWRAGMNCTGKKVENDHYALTALIYYLLSSATFSLPCDDWHFKSTVYL